MLARVLTLSSEAGPWGRAGLLSDTTSQYMTCVLDSSCICWYALRLAAPIAHRPEASVRAAFLFCESQDRERMHRL